MEQPQVSGVVGKSGPPRNGNAATHFVHSWLRRGKLPAEPWAKAIERDLARMQASLVDGVAAAHGKVSDTRALLVNGAVRHEGVARLVLHWIRSETLPIEQRLTALKLIGQATDRRNATITELDLDRPQDAIDVATVLREIHREQAAQHAVASDGSGQDGPSIEPSDSDASELKPCDTPQAETSERGGTVNAIVAESESAATVLDG